MVLNALKTMCFVKSLLLATIFFSLPWPIRAQVVYGTIKYNWQNAHRPDTNAKIYLCQRTRDLKVNRDKVMLAERVLREFDLSRAGTPSQAAASKRTLKREYGIRDSADIQKYLRDAADEETKIASTNEVQIRFVDSNGYYIFNNLAPGPYWLFIRSAHTNKFACFALDVVEKDNVVVSRLFDEYSAKKQKKFYLNPSRP